jgi:hypothetical protein
MIIFTASFQKEAPVFLNNSREEVGAHIFLRNSKKGDYRGLAM